MENLKNKTKNKHNIIDNQTNKIIFFKLKNNRYFWYRITNLKKRRRKNLKPSTTTIVLEINILWSFVNVIAKKKL